MKSIWIVFLMIALSAYSRAQIGMGQWKMHISPYQAIDVAQGNNAVYAILSRGMLEYDLSAGEKSIWTAANYLSDVSPTALAYDDASDQLIIGYDNGNLDLIRNEAVYNLTAILQSSISGEKGINNIYCHGGNAYLATGVGIVVINLNKREVRDTYNPSPLNDGILDVAVYNDSIFALSEGTLRVGAVNNNFLADPAQWQTISAFPDYSSTGRYNALASVHDELYISYNSEIYNADTLYRYDDGNPTIVMNEVELLGLSTSENELVVNIAGGMMTYDQNFTETNNIFQYSHGAFPEPQNALFHDGHFYLADGRSGLVKAANAYNSEQITFEGPRYNDAYRAEWANGKLAVAGGGLNGTGPSFSRRGGAMLEDGKWTSVMESNQPIIQGQDIWDYISVAINPSNTDEVAFGTFSEIPLIKVENDAIVDTFAYSNSLLEGDTEGTNWGYVSDLKFDEDENLWVANAFADQPLKVRAADGSWYSFNQGNAVKSKLTTRIAIDNNNVKWMGVDGTGIVAFDHGENLDDASDDQYQVFNTSENSGALPTSTVEAIAVDFSNNIWIGTPEGMRVLYNSSNIFEASPGEYNFQKLLIEFGENVEIVLGTTHITDIAIDGANRKWIATASSGVFLLAEDGLSVIRNFTSENSPLLDNNVLDIAIDQNTGEVYFVTNEGMISYRSDASQGDLSYSNVKVFPNPVRPDYFGPVTIQGIAFNSSVKVTDIAGNLVYQTTSNGGTATWDGQTLDGERAATGVYLIWTSVNDADTKGRQVGKVVFIN
ncbi:MAG: hypothetical protein ACQERC_03430 [Bacteroidota bacterium]